MATDAFATVPEIAYDPLVGFTGCVTGWEPPAKIDFATYAELLTYFGTRGVASYATLAVATPVSGGVPMVVCVRPTANVQTGHGARRLHECAVSEAAKAGVRVVSEAEDGAAGNVRAQSEYMFRPRGAAGTYFGKHFLRAVDVGNIGKQDAMHALLKGFNAAKRKQRRIIGPGLALYPREVFEAELKRLAGLKKPGVPKAKLTVAQVASDRESVTSDYVGAEGLAHPDTTRALLGLREDADVFGEFLFPRAGADGKV